MSKYIECCELLSFLGSYSKTIQDNQEEDWYSIFSFNLLNTLNNEGRLCEMRCKLFFAKVRAKQERFI